MTVFELSSDAEFIWSESRGLISVSKLDNISNPTVGDTNWKHRVACIGAGEIYETLKIYNVKIHGQELKDLAQKIGDAFVLINREGYCFLSTHLTAGSSFHAQYFRLNDLFDWSAFNVKPLIQTLWNRSGLEDAKVILDLHKGAQIIQQVVRDEEDEEDVEDEEDEEPIFDVNEMVGKRQMNIPSKRFTISKDARQQYFTKLHNNSTSLPEFKPLNEDVLSKFPEEMVVHTLDGEFDSEMWWAVKAKMGRKKCMIGYYGGSHNRVLMDDGDQYYLPYNQGQTLTANTQFFVARMHDAGMVCLAFMY